MRWYPTKGCTCEPVRSASTGDTLKYSGEEWSVALVDAEDGGWWTVGVGRWGDGRY